MVKKEKIFKHISFDESLKDCDELVKFYQKIEDFKKFEPWSKGMDNLVKENPEMDKFLRCYDTELPPVVSFIGSLASAEAIKLISHNYFQYFWVF